ncbi:MULTISPECIES: tubulin/FtsZ family protein [Archaeoglobus]|jgi:cell division GTPase FtsZ|nr:MULTISPECIES: tubulin/FtsZ family protein [Archaeoglobus]AIG98089.1 Cell division GTPase [Archaeoglobus fulgidus DSM 8774]KUJ93663.1 MAG: Cell division protein, putative [Archaeoglobus fulgidus]KUK06078.1 MAG: Cell division protein, putative [Archaeoglobus fulgidus]MDI3498061.1 tubulin-like protein CetZ [Archaeoglobus sp.]
MRFFIIGFGQAGGKILDMFIENEKMRGSNIRMRWLAINSARTDLMGLKHVPVQDRILIGQTIVKGHGVGTDNKLGAKVAQEDIETILNAIDERGTHDMDAFLIVAGLGGGTGSGGAPVLAKYLSEMYSEPVYAVGILPAPEEGKLYSLNAARSMISLLKYVDNLILVDNGAWKFEGTSLKESFAKINEEIVRRLALLARAGEPIEEDVVGEMVVDSSEVVNTLRGGGISSIGYATTLAESSEKKRKGFRLFGRKEEEEIEALENDKPMKIATLVRRAALGRLTVPCNIHSAERALVLVAGPPEHLDRKGLEKAKIWLEEQIAGVEVRAGDYPTRRTKYVAALVLLANVTDIPRVKELQRLAAEAKEEAEEAEKMRMTKTIELFDEDIEPLI